MRRDLRLPFALALLTGCTAGSESSRPGKDMSAPVPGRSGRSVAHGDAVPRDTANIPDSIRRPPVPLVPAPNPERGLYVNRWAAIGERMWQLIDIAKATEVNALVIDVKDDRGLVLYHSRVPLARAINADTARPMSYRRLRAVLDTMRKYHIYPVARIVVAKDPLLAHARRELAIQRRADHLPWLGTGGQPWLDPHHPEIWQYAADLAAEAVGLGFSEVQFDYVRFPDDKRLLREAVFPLANGRPRAQVIREQLAFLRARMAPLRVPMTIDVFGLTATDATDMGIGQRWEMFVDRADVVLPMDYPSHFARGTYGLRNPNAHPYTTVARALRDAKRRSEGIANAARLVPWYQDFTLGPPHYHAAQVRAQIEAGYDNGISSWMLWNPRSHYDRAALRPAPDTMQAADPEAAPIATDGSRPRSSPLHAAPRAEVAAPRK